MLIEKCFPVQLRIMAFSDKSANSSDPTGVCQFGQRLPVVCQVKSADLFTHVHVHIADGRKDVTAAAINRFCISSRQIFSERNYLSSFNQNIQFGKTSFLPDQTISEQLFHLKLAQLRYLSDRAL